MEEYRVRPYWPHGSWGALPHRSGCIGQVRGAMTYVRTKPPHIIANSSSWPHGPTYCLRGTSYVFSGSKLFATRENIRLSFEAGYTSSTNTLLHTYVHIVAQGHSGLQGSTPGLLYVNDGCCIRLSTCFALAGRGVKSWLASIYRCLPALGMASVWPWQGSM